tara:strand:+ start:5740 stop:6543 length:804 start_codon:yes stop_codon:yes gene_type:complete
MPGKKNTKGGKGFKRGVKNSSTEPYITRKSGLQNNAVSKKKKKKAAETKKKLAEKKKTANKNGKPTKRMTIHMKKHNPIKRDIEQKNTIEDNDQQEGKSDYCGKEYAIVIKLLGFGRVHVRIIANDTESPYYYMGGTVVLGIIKGKLKKRKDFINLNDIIIVGIRDWATDKSKVDIVWVYKDPGNIKKLINNNEMTESQVLSGFDIKSNNDCGIEFEEQSKEDLARMKKQLDIKPKEEGGKMMNVTYNVTDPYSSNELEDEVDFDSI